MKIACVKPQVLLSSLTHHLPTNQYAVNGQR